MGRSAAVQTQTISAALCSLRLLTVRGHSNKRVHLPKAPTNEVRKTSNEYHGVANNLWTLNVKNLRGFVAKDCEIQS